MADTKKKTTTKSSAKSTKAKAAEKPNVGSSTNKSQTDAKAVSATSAIKTESKPEVVQKTETIKKPEKPSAKAAAEKQTANKAETKRSGNGVASFALLCALGALGLSGYNLYERKFSSEAGSAKTLLSGVNEIGNNVSEFGNVVTALQAEVTSITDKQAQFVKVSAVDLLVSKKVSEAVNEVVQGGEISTGAVSDSYLKNDTAINSYSKNDTTSSSLPLLGGSMPKAEPNLSSVSNDSESMVKDGNAELESWSWERAKTDFFDMFNFVSIRKKDENNN
jgi:hypothetical protein